MTAGGGGPRWAALVLWVGLAVRGAGPSLVAGAGDGNQSQSIQVQPVPTFDVPALCQRYYGNGWSGGGGGGDRDASRPTVLFLHVFKAAGSSTRDMMKEYARSCSLRFASCGSACHGTGNSGFICLKDGLVQSRRQTDTLRRTDVVAGHLWYGMHRHVDNAVYITCLRDPLQTAVSGQLYTHSRELKHADDAEAAVKVFRWVNPATPQVGFVKRLTGAVPSKTPTALAKATQKAIDNLRFRFAVVGVVERYSVFVDLVQHLVDPQAKLGRDFWAKHKAKRKNSSRQSTSGVIKALGQRDAVWLRQLNASLALEWKIYFAATEICAAHERERLLPIVER